MTVEDQFKKFKQNNWPTEHFITCKYYYRQSIPLGVCPCDCEALHVFDAGYAACMKNMKSNPPSPIKAPID